MEVSPVATALRTDWPSDERDPRVDAAVEDFRAAVIDLRRLSAALFELPAGSSHRPPLKEQIDDLIGGMQARCDMLGIDLDQLFQLINDDLAARRGGGNDHRPHGDHLRALVDEVNGAYADEATIHRNITRLQDLLPGAAARRIAADRACAGFVAGWPERGR
jgi:signal transduction histidine kinase